MLDGKHLGGRHQAALPSVGRTHEKRKKSQNCFPASHIPLHQPVHSIFTAHVRFYFRPYPQLGARQPVRKARQEPLRILHASKRLFHPADLVVLLQLPKRQEKLQEFVKGQPSPGFHQFLRTLGKMDLFQRICIRNETEFLPDVSRKVFRQGDAFQRPSHRLAHTIIGQAHG